MLTITTFVLISRVKRLRYFVWFLIFGFWFFKENGLAYEGVDRKNFCGGIFCKERKVRQATSLVDSSE